MFLRMTEKIKSFFKLSDKKQKEDVVIVQKSCPHCVSRGMFVFKNTTIHNLSNDSKNETV